MARLAGGDGNAARSCLSRWLGSLTFKQWANEAEEGLIDLRKTGAFKGKGTLLQKARRDAEVAPWETGTSADVVAAMTVFRAGISEGSVGALADGAHRTGRVSGLVESGLRSGYSVRITSASNMASSMTVWISGSYRPGPAGSSCCCSTFRWTMLMGARW